MLKSKSLLPLALLLLVSTVGISRDGTLPVAMDGSAYRVPNNGRELSASLDFNDRGRLSNIPFSCQLRSSQLRSDRAAGSLALGGQSFKILGTCDDGLGSYEVVAVPRSANNASRTVNLIGKVSESNGRTVFKGRLRQGASSPLENLKFELRE